MTRAPGALRAKGLTLLEMLVAIAVFALLSVMTFVALDQILRVRDRVTDERRFWTGLAMCFAQLHDDLSQARPRTIIDDDGQTLAAFIVRPQDMRTRDAPELELTRGGVLVVGNAMSSDLERVGYALRHHVLWRMSWPVLDRAPDTVPVKEAVLHNVTRFRVHVFTPEKLWSDIWPPLPVAASVTTVVNPLPRGVEVNLSVRGRGRFKWLFLVNG